MRKKSAPSSTIVVVLFLIMGLMLVTHTAHAIKPVQESIELSDDVEATVDRYEAKSKHLVIWIAPDFGFRKGQAEMSAMLAKKGIEVWMVDMSETLFLTQGSASMKKMTGKYVADLIEQAHKKTGKKITVMSSFYGCIPVLRGIKKWQEREQKSSYLMGAILKSPYLLSSIPALGTEPDYLPVTTTSNTPIFILQAEKIGNFWQFGNLLKKLKQGGSNVYYKVIPGITSLYYKEERFPELEKAFQQTPANILYALKLFEQSPAPLTNKKIPTEKAKVHKALDITLRKFKGDPTPKPISLTDIKGKQHTIDSFKGKVTIINFWATWCPPCVEEIPSLNRLAKKMKDIPFRLISIDYAEKDDVVKKFMKEIKVDFPVLMDRDGSQSKKWKVLAFPSTFIIGPDGKIHYGVNAAIQWDSPEVIKKIKDLVKTQ